MGTGKITEKEVRHAALLARLSMTDSDIATFTIQLNSILSAMDALGKVDTTGVVPTSHPVAVPTPLRDDVVAPSLTHTDALSNAPMADKGFFKVPKIIE